MSELKAAIDIAERFRVQADKKFNEICRRAKRGERNLDWAAACAAGMSHTARRIADALIAALEEKP